MGNYTAKLKQIIFPQASNKPIKTIITGLQQSGKTTILYKLATGISKPLLTNLPIDFRIQDIKINEQVTIEVWDMTAFRLKDMMKKYYDGVKAVIWVLDCGESKRIELVKKSLYETISHAKLKDVVVLFLSNKSDLAETGKDFLTCEDLISKLDLDQLTQRGVSWKIFSCSALKMLGFKQALNWIAQNLVHK